MSYRENGTVSLRNKHDSLLAYDDEKNIYTVRITRIVLSTFKKAWLILLLTSIGFFAGLIIPSFIIPEYKVTTHLTEPDYNEITKLYETTKGWLTPKELFTLFVNKLKNPDTFKLFLKNDPTVKDISKDTEHFKIKYHVQINRNKGTLKETIKYNNHTITDDGFDADLIITSSIMDKDAHLNLAYITFTNTLLLKEFSTLQKNIFHSEINKLKKDINNQIQALNQPYKDNANTVNSSRVKKTNKNKPKDNSNSLSKLITNYEHLLKTKNARETNSLSLLEMKLKLYQLKSLNFKTSSITSYTIDESGSSFKVLDYRKILITLGAGLGFSLAIILIILQLSVKINKELELTMLARA